MRRSLIIADSMVKGFHELRKTDVIMRRGADPLRMLKYLEDNTHLLKMQYKIVILHIGTNYFSTKEEWGQYLNFINDQCTFEDYNDYLYYHAPNPAKGSANNFKVIILRIINLINSYTNALILISGIIPRPWDNDRRGNIIATYNRMLRSIQNPYVLYINTPKLFLDQWSSSYNKTIQLGWTASKCWRLQTTTVIFWGKNLGHDKVI